MTVSLYQAQLTKLICKIMFTFSLMYSDLIISLVIMESP